MLIDIKSVITLVCATAIALVAILSTGDMVVATAVSGALVAIFGSQIAKPKEEEEEEKT